MENNNRDIFGIYDENIVYDVSNLHVIKGKIRNRMIITISVNFNLVPN